MPEFCLCVFSGHSLGGENTQTKSPQKFRVNPVKFCLRVFVFLCVCVLFHSPKVVRKKTLGLLQSPFLDNRSDIVIQLIAGIPLQFLIFKPKSFHADFLLTGEINRRIGVKLPILSGTLQFHCYLFLQK